MLENEITQKENDEINDNSKLKLIIISKKGKLDKSNEGTVITLKKDEGRMELRMDNISENITKNKIDKTLQSFMFNKSISNFKIKNKNFVIVDKKSNNLSEREKLKKNYTENKKNYEIHINNHPKIIEEKIKEIRTINNYCDKPKMYESQKNNDIFVNENIDINNNKSNNLNNIINNSVTNVDENSAKDDELIFVNNNNTNENTDQNFYEHNNNKKENKENSALEINIIKNFEEMKQDERNINKKEMNTEPNNPNHNKRNKLRELLKKENLTNEGDEEEEIEECEEDIISYNENNENNENKNNNTNNKLSSYRDLESNIARIDQSEKDNKYIISSINEGLSNFNKFFRNTINSNTNNNNIEKIINANININKDNESEIKKSNNIPEETVNINNKLIDKKYTLSNSSTFKHLIDSKELAHSKNTLINKRKIDNEENINYNRKIVFQSNFNINNNFIHVRNLHPIYKTCSICENSTPASKTYVSECAMHFICKKCAKNYFEEQIENGETDLHCPFLYCKKTFPKILTKNFLSEEHYLLLEKNNNKNKMMLAKIKSNVNYEQMKMYSKNNVIDINNNKILFNYNKSKDIFCSKCKIDALFSKANNYFLKCLNCGHCECKYCFKDYINGHFDINNAMHCKVYYRRKDDYTQIKPFIFFLLQLSLVFAIFFMIYISIFLNIKLFLQNKFRIYRNKTSCFFYYFNIFFIVIISITILLIVFPFIFIFYPYFPLILSSTDY